MASAFAFAKSLKCRCGRGACDTHEQTPMTQVAKVLPPTVEPLRYFVDLDLHIDKHTFDGDVRVEVDVVQETTTITLHANDLTVKTASFDGVGDAISIESNAEEFTVTFTFAKTLPLGAGTLRIIFTGKHNDQMNGFYRSSYKDVHGETKTMVSTQMEPVDARKAFPCWDEPLRKATFTCSLRVPSHMTALSNMPESSITTHADGTKTVAFVETPKMSTYLLAFVVCEMDFISTITKQGVVIRVFTPQGKPHLGKFALECAKNALEWYDEAFGMPYPLPKSDMVAIPDFAMGAMENWGLITYREVDLLVDKSASSTQRQRVAEVVIHELAHQWFGNLVTMEWWDDLWLNEGFATWMEFGLLAKLEPDWCIWEQFLNDMQARALSLDALRSSHPIQVPIAKGEEVDQVFDAISYSKGGSVVRMIHAVLGDEAFYAGLRDYMKQFAYANARTDDLWKAWERASGKPISKMMGTWVKQLGFPLLELVDARPAPGGKVTCTLKQSWFLADGSKVAAEDEKVWPIPVFASCSGGPSAGEIEPKKLGYGMMDRAKQTLTFEGDGTFVKLNAGQYVPMRVKYPAVMVPALAKAVREKTLSTFDRMGLLMDHSALAKAGQISPVVFLELLAAYADEDEPVVNDLLVQYLSGIGKLLMAAPELHGPYLAFAKKMVTPKLAKVGWDARESDGHMTRIFRGMLINGLNAICPDDPAVQAEARRRYDLYLSDPDPTKSKGKEAVPDEFATSIFKLVSRAGGEAVHDQMMNLWKQSEQNVDKVKFLQALGAAPTPALRTKALDFATSGDVKLQDFFYVIISMHGASSAGMEATWQYFVANLDKIHGMIKDASSSIMHSVIAGVCSLFATPERIDEVAAFFAKHDAIFKIHEMKINQVLETCRTNAAYLDAFRKSGAKEWLEKNAAAEVS